MLTWGDTGCDISRAARDDLGFLDQQPPRNDYTGDRRRSIAPVVSPIRPQIGKHVVIDVNS